MSAMHRLALATRRSADQRTSMTVLADRHAQDASQFLAHETRIRTAPTNHIPAPLADAETGGTAHPLQDLRDLHKDRQLPGNQDV